MWQSRVRLQPYLHHLACVERRSLTARFWSREICAPLHQFALHALPATLPVLRDACALGLRSAWPPFHPCQGWSAHAALSCILQDCARTSTTGTGHGSAGIMYCDCAMGVPAYVLLPKQHHTIASETQTKPTLMTPRFIRFCCNGHGA